MVRFWEYWRGSCQGVLIGWIVIGMGLGHSVLMWPAVWLLQSLQFAALVMAARGVIEGKLEQASLGVHLPLS